MTHEVLGRKRGGKSKKKQNGVGGGEKRIKQYVSHMYDQNDSNLINICLFLLSKNVQLLFLLMRRAPSCIGNGCLELGILKECIKKKAVILNGQA